MNFPTRFFTGIRNITIPNPAWLHRSTNEVSYLGRRRHGEAKTFEGRCEDYNFDRQAENYIRLRNVLRKFGTDFLYVAAAKYTGDLHTNHRFVACSADGSLLWHKYVGFVAQSGQNHVFVGGKRIKVSIFLGLNEEQQMALLSGSESRIQQAFVNGPKLSYINEDRTLWN